MKRWLVAGLGGLALALIGFTVTLAFLPPASVAAAINGRVVTIELADRGALEQALREAARAIEEQPIEFIYEESRQRYTAAELGARVELEAALAQAVAYLYPEETWVRFLRARELRALEQLEVPLTITFEPGRVEQLFGPLAAELARPPVNASFHLEGQEPVITPHLEGRQLDLTALAAATQVAIRQGLSQVELPIVTIEPEVTTAAIEAMKIKRLLTSYSTHYDPTIPRADNVALAAQAFDNLLVAPGETISFNELIGPATVENGYKEAYVIENGRLVDGIGGGICQVSSTLYGAVLTAGLEVVERHRHYLAISYLPPSLDAAIWQEGGQDFRFTNQTDGYMLFRSYAEGGTLTFEVYGDAPEGQVIELVSEVIQVLPFDDLIEEDASLPPGQEVTKIAGINGAQSVGYRLYYQDGQLVKKEQLSVDTYAPSARVVLKGPELPPEPAGAATEPAPANAEPATADTEPAPADAEQPHPPTAGDAE